MILCVHHDGAVPCHRFFERFSRDQKEPDAVLSGFHLYVIAAVEGGYTPDGWMIYGQHPAWTVMTLLGPGVEAVPGAGGTDGGVAAWYW